MEEKTIEDALCLHVFNIQRTKPAAQSCMLVYMKGCRCSLLHWFRLFLLENESRSVPLYAGWRQSRYQPEPAFLLTNKGATQEDHGLVGSSPVASIRLECSTWYLQTVMPVRVLTPRTALHPHTSNSAHLIVYQDVKDIVTWFVFNFFSQEKF